MAMVYFLKVNGIPGESADAVHKDEIEVLSVGWGLSQSGSAMAGPGAGAGKAMFHDFRFSMRQNRASPALWLACAQGQKISEAVLTARKSGANQPDFFTVTLSDFIVSSFEETGDVEITQQVTFDYSKIQYEYKQQSADGSLTDVPAVGWDLAANAKI